MTNTRNVPGASLVQVHYNILITFCRIQSTFNLDFKLVVDLTYVRMGILNILERKYRNFIERNGRKWRLKYREISQKTCRLLRRCALQPLFKNLSTCHLNIED